MVRNLIRRTVCRRARRGSGGRRRAPANRADQDGDGGEDRASTIRHRYGDHQVEDRLRRPPTGSGRTDSTTCHEASGELASVVVFVHVGDPAAPCAAPHRGRSPALDGGRQRRGILGGRHDPAVCLPIPRERLRLRHRGNDWSSGAPCSRRAYSASRPPTGARPGGQKARVGSRQPRGDIRLGNRRRETDVAQLSCSARSINSLCDRRRRRARCDAGIGLQQGRRSSTVNSEL